MLRPNAEEKDGWPLVNIELKARNNERNGKRICDCLKSHRKIQPRFTLPPHLRPRMNAYVCGTRTHPGSPPSVSCRRCRGPRSADPLDPIDGYMVLRNSELMCGNMCKGALGGSKKGLFYALVRDTPSSHCAARVMNRLAKLSARFIGDVRRLTSPHATSPHLASRHVRQRLF